MLHALRIGPIETGDGKAYAYLAAGDEDGGLIVPQIATSDLDGLRWLVREAGGRKVRCEKALAKAAAKLGLDVGEPPRWTDVPRALFATVLAHGPGLEPFPFEVFGEVVRALIALLELEPWRKWPADVPFEVHVSGAMRGQYEAALMGYMGQEFGVVLYDRPGAMARLIERGEAGDTEGMGRIDCLALSLDDEPRFAAKACERAFDLPGAPGMRAMRGGRPRRVKGREVGLLAATGLALAELSPERPSGRASVFGVDVQVRAPSDARRPQLVAVPAAPERAKIGRNDPCPCGSGKKYKKCHARDDEAADRGAPVAPEHGLDHEIVEDMLAWAEEHLGRPALSKAFAAVPPACLEGEAVFCTSWVLYEHPIDGRPIAARYLEALGTALGRDERDWIEAQLRARLSLWEVLSIRPGVLEMRDLFSGETREVHDHGAASSLMPRLVLLGRVVEAAGRALLGTAHTRPLAPLDADAVVQAVGRKRGPRTGAKLIGAWDAVVDELARRPPPRVTNTDGEPLLWTTDHFAIEKDGVETVVKALAALTEGGSPEALGDERRFTITKLGNRMHASWENTVIGTLTIAGTSLQAQSNSVQRADALRRSIAACCGRLVQHRARTHSDPTASLGEAPREGRPEPPHPPEVLAALREMKTRHMQSWLDEPVPALGGKTPREAARSKKSRAKLDLLLRDMESWEARQPAAERFDVRALRAELGMDR